MAFEIIMPRQGNSVESCILNSWLKSEGDAVKTGDLIAIIETDKAAFELESPADGILLKQFFPEGEDIPILTVIGAIGEAGENVEQLAPKDSSDKSKVSAAPAPEPVTEAPAPEPVTEAPAPTASEGADSSLVRDGGYLPISPRARLLAASKGLAIGSIVGTGPAGRIIERDILKVLGAKEPLSPAAVEALINEGLQAPNVGSGIGGRVLRSDLVVGESLSANVPPSAPAAITADETTTIPVKGVRKIVASRMLESLNKTAQLTLNASAEASSMLSYRSRLKQAPEALGVNKITLNDFILYAVSRILPLYPEINAHFLGDKIIQYKNIHIAMAVDSPRGLMVPVIRNAQNLSLKQISLESKRLSAACIQGTIQPEELSGSTFTLSNLGAMGIESFTPIINPPEVAILGVCSIQLKPVEQKGEVSFVPHMGLSLTMDHQATDGAPAARFLRELCDALKDFELTLAI